MPCAPLMPTADVRLQAQWLLSSRGAEGDGKPAAHAGSRWRWVMTQVPTRRSQLFPCAGWRCSSPRTRARSKPAQRTSSASFACHGLWCLHLQPCNCRRTNPGTAMSLSTQSCLGVHRFLVAVYWHWGSLCQPPRWRWGQTSITGISEWRACRGGIDPFTTGGGPSLTQSDEAGRFSSDGGTAEVNMSCRSVLGATPLRRVYVRPGEQQQLDIAWNVPARSKTGHQESRQPTRSDTTRTGEFSRLRRCRSFPPAFWKIWRCKYRVWRPLIRPFSVRSSGGLGFGNRFH